ncbi:MAG: DUF3016 domain-containing protein [Gammaproteobacteria bacterium]|nr:DUF3016 domain-containing protein [Gammaproteobacteria bacterium]
MLAQATIFRRQDPTRRLSARIYLAYTPIGADGNVIASGERRRRDLSYLMTTVSRTDADPLVYEKLLAREWLWREFNR